MNRPDRARVAVVDAPDVAEALDGAPVAVETASSVQAAARTQPDCVVVADPDPEQLGLLRQHAPGATVVAVTAEPEGALDAGAADTLDPALVASHPGVARRRVVDAARAVAFRSRRRLADATDDATAVVGTDGRLRTVDEAFAALTGRAAADLVGDSAAGALGGRHVDLILGAAEGLASEPESVAVFEHETESGRRLETRVAPVLVDGTLDAVAVAVRDVTDRELLTAELQRRAERLEEVASLVSHDLRNPLNVVSGRLQLAEETSDMDHVEPARAATRRVVDLVDDVQALARRGRRVTETTPLDLGLVARVAWGSVETGTATLDADPASGTTVEADEERLQALFRQLFENAAVHAGSDVTVTVEPTADGFAVVDDGAGFDDGGESRLLDPGFTTADGRTGFGLAVVTAIADAHGWTVETGTSTAGGALVAFHTDSGPRPGPGSGSTPP